MVIQLRQRLGRLARGQGLVEFAMILPVLMLVLLLAIDFGRVFFGWVGLANASRIGASYAAAHPDAWGTPGNALEQAAYVDQILADANALNCTLPGVIPDPVFPSGTDLGYPAQVTLTCNFSLITPLVSHILGNTISISADSIFPIRAGLAGGVPVGSLPPTPSPSPTPSATPDPSVTPAPTPVPCIAPSFIGDKVGHANLPNPLIQLKWAAAGFTTTVIVTRPPNNDYTVQTQGPLVGGQPGDCDTTVMTVGP
jgi:hypothetical protein